MKKEKKNPESEFCVISRELANSRLKYLTENQSSRNVLDEYFMWIKVLQSGVNLVNQDEIVNLNETNKELSN